MIKLACCGVIRRTSTFCDVAKTAQTHRAQEVIREVHLEGALQIPDEPDQFDTVHRRQLLSNISVGSVIHDLGLIGPPGPETLDNIAPEPTRL